MGDQSELNITGEPDPSNSSKRRRRGFLQALPLQSISLRWKVALSFSILLILVAGTVAMALVRYEWIFLSKEAEKRADLLAVNLAVNARDPILVQDEMRFGTIIESIMMEEDVKYAFLLDNRMEVVYHSDANKIGDVFAGGIPKTGKSVIQKVVDIEVEGVMVGTAVVGLGADHIHSAMVTTIIGALVPLLVGTVLGVLGIFFLAGIHVKKIESLDMAVQALGAGNLFIEVDVNSQDEVGRLTAHFNEMVGMLNTARQQVLKNFTETVNALAATVEAKDAYTKGHCERVALISNAIAQRVGMNESAMKDLAMAAILHDIGKIGVEGDIISKLGPLDDLEVDNMKHHPVIGARILSPLSTLGRVSLYVKHHHEHYDGTGYPSGLRGEMIPLPSRIIHLVDAYDAMTSNRPYRHALSPGEAVERIKEGEGFQFDPELVEVFLKLESEGVIAHIYDEVVRSEPGLS